MGDAYWSKRFPVLFEEQYVPYAGCMTRCTTASAPDDLVARLHLVAVTTRAEVVVCRSAQGWRFLPGGTREPGESLRDLARRELMEEAGAVLRGELRFFVSHVADSARRRPHRPHLPHPRAHWSYAVADVQVVGEPTNPPGGEDVVEVLTLSALRAAAFIEEHDPVHADVVRLADAMGLIRPASRRQASTA